MWLCYQWNYLCDLAGCHMYHFRDAELWRWRGIYPPSFWVYQFFIRPAGRWERRTDLRTLNYQGPMSRDGLVIKNLTSLFPAIYKNNSNYSETTQSKQSAKSRLICRPRRWDYLTFWYHRDILRSYDRYHGF